MIKKINELDNNNSETLRKSEKALMILGDLSDTYSFMGEQPTKKEADKLAHEAERILQYINIAIDYVYEIKNDLKQVAESLYDLNEKTKQINPVSENGNLGNASVKVNTSMDKDFMQYVYARIEKALTENEKYMELQRKCVDASNSNDINLYENLSSETEAQAQELCYVQGYNDAMRMILNLK